MPFAGIAFLWFIGVMRHQLGTREDQFYATVMLASGVLFVGMVFVAFAFVTGILAAREVSTDSAALVGFVNDQSIAKQIFAGRFAAGGRSARLDRPPSPGSVDPDFLQERFTWCVDALSPDRGA